MHGHGYATQPPPPPAGNTHVTLRVVFVALAVVTCGMLAWAPMLRLGLVTRKAHDWVLFAAVTALDVTALVLIGIDPGEEDFQGPGNAGMIVLLSTLLAAVAYYLFADIRHFSAHRRFRPAPFTGYAPPPAAYGYPQQPTPPGPVHLAPTQFGAPPNTPPPTHTPPPSSHTPPPGRPAPARINQVRAELDELSDYLRKQEGGS
ncbi:hypothetical protein [Streptomyces sp. NPDC002564]|uniref:hypothetical protein n=1 Tax=Streptomyces sp. NPDC002564 TaxID=3364649 RepID=UPI00367E8864